MKYRIVNRRRFIISCVVLILLFSFAISGIRGSATALDRSKTEYETILVNPGDTLWGLAKEYGRPGEDIRILVHEICDINNVSPEKLFPGQHLLIPKG